MIEHGIDQEVGTLVKDMVPQCCGAIANLLVGHSRLQVEAEGAEGAGGIRKAGGMDLEFLIVARIGGGLGGSKAVFLEQSGMGCIGLSWIGGGYRGGLLPAGKQFGEQRRWRSGSDWSRQGEARNEKHGHGRKR